LAKISGNNSEVEVWRGGLGSAYLFSGSFVCRCLNSFTLPRFHTPLIEPDRRISRIRLSEEVSRVRPRKTGGPLGEPDQTKLQV
jgi:hypothetical protein